MELVSYLASVTARSLGLAGVALAGVWLFRVKTAAARHAALTVVTGGMLLLAALTATLPAIPLRVLRAERAAPVVAAAQIDWLDSLPSTDAGGFDQSRERQRVVAPQASWLPQFAWTAVASAVYFSIATLLLLRLAYSFLFTRRLVRASYQAEEGRPGGPPHCRGQRDTYESTWISVPMTVGWLRPKIILPAAWKEWDARKLEAVLAHERMHIRRADWAIALLAAFNRCVFWFNPLAWWMEHKLVLLAEEACDDAALLETGAREPYAEALLDMAAAVRTGRGRMVWEAMAMARTAEVRKRIERVLDESRQIPRGLTRGRWAALLACSLPLMYVAAVARLAPAQDIRPAPHAEYAGPAKAAQPQPAQVALAQATGGKIIVFGTQARREAAPVALAQALPAPATPAGAGAGMGGRGGASLTPPSAARPGEIKYKDSRLLVLYFDLLGMATDDQIRVQSNAQTFISAQITPSDLVAVMTYAGELKVLQDFTDDRSLLSQAIRNLPASSGQASTGSSSYDTEFNLFNADRQLAALESAVKMLGTLPEKKALVYFGSGITRNGITNDLQLRATIDAALRANVAFYPVDARGQVGATPVGSASAGAAGASLQFQTAVAETVVRASAQAPYPYLLFMNATPVQTAEPVYPAEAMASGVQGFVGFDIIVGTDGHVRSAQVIGPRNPLLEAAAREAVSHYVYQPARAPNGELAEIETTATVPFRLRGVPAQEPTKDTIAEMRVLTQNYQAQYGRNIADPGGGHPAQVLSKVDPEYPYTLRAQGYQGAVTLEVTVGVDGVPKDIRVVRSDPSLDAAAIAAVSQWRFTPARRNGQPVESTVTLPISFRLE